MFLILISILAIECLLVAIEYFGSATFLIILTSLGLHYFNVINLMYIVHEPISSLLYFLSYLAIGFIWSFAKFAFFVSKIKKSLDIRNESNVRIDVSERIDVSDHKSRIICWIYLWPASFISTMIDDPVRRFLSLIFNLTKKIYQKIADSIIESA